MKPWRTPFSPEQKEFLTGQYRAKGKHPYGPYPSGAECEAMAAATKLTVEQVPSKAGMPLPFSCVQSLTRSVVRR